MKRILSSDGVKTETFHMDNDGKVTIHKKTDVSNILKENQFKRDHQSMRHENEVFNHKARIPIDAITEWCKVRGIKYREFMQDKNLFRAFLNDPDNKVWLTRTGKV